VGSAYKISVESIAALNPDLIIIEALNQQTIIDSLQTLGAPVIAIRAASLADIDQSLALLGNIIDKNEAATQAVADIHSDIEAVQGNATGNESVLILIADANRIVYAAKPESYPGTIAALLNLSNPAAGLPENFLPGFTLFTAEQALASNPDVVFTITPAPAPAPRLSTLLPQFPGFKDMAAVKDGRVIELDPVLFLQAPGPRIADAMEEMLRLMSEIAP
jgi:iron complex transport system substrate-binding protein